MFNIWKHDEFYRGLMFKPLLLDFVESVLGPEIQLLHDQVFYKPPFDGAPSDWHQDNQYFKFSPANLCSIWIALDDVDTENSCLYFVPGSHREPSPPSVTIQSPTGIELHSLDIDETRAKPFPMPAGHALMHHCMTIHGAYANRSPRGRRALGLHYMQPGLNHPHAETYRNVEEYPILRSPTVVGASRSH